MADTLGFADNQGVVEASIHDANVQKENDTSVERPSVKAPLRPATLKDVDTAHAFLMDAVNDSPFYSQRFKQHEMGRLNKQFLKSLIAVNPNHVFIVEVEGEPAGVMISGPELGTLWLYWTYVAPKFRRASLAMGVLRSFMEYWDNGHFHKVSTYVRPGNDTAIAMVKRYKFDLTCLLQKHVFGEDYLLYERQFTKAEAGYDSGMGMGRLGLVMQYLRGLIGR